MDLLSEQFCLENKHRLTTRFTIFLVLCAVCLACYVLSFLANRLWVALTAGLAGVLLCILFYFLVVFDVSKLQKLIKHTHQGIHQTETYCFHAFDEDTEHDGVEMKRLLCSAKEEDTGEEYDRVLYLVKAALMPQLSEGQQFTAQTYQNIILFIEI